MAERNRPSSPIYADAHRTLERPQQSDSDRQGKSAEPARKSRHVAAKIAGGLALTLLAVGAYGATEIYPKRAKHESELFNARDAQIGQINASQSKGDHINRLTGTVILLEGSHLRDSATETNQKYSYNLLFKKGSVIPGNIEKTVGADEALVFTNPNFLQQDGVVWIQGIPKPSSSGSFEKGSAEALAKATVSVNLTGLLEQKAALVCNQGKASYSTVSQNFGYEDPHGQPTAEYEPLTTIKDALSYEAKNKLDCVYTLK